MIDTSQVQIENTISSLTVDPAQGGKVVALFDRRLGRNLLLPREPSADLPLPDGAVFSISGWDECLPTVEASAGALDLGHAWRTPPACTIDSERLATCWTIPGWEMRRDICLGDDGLDASYMIRNTGDAPAPVLWAAHVLFPLAGLQHLILPMEEALPGPGCDLAELRERMRGTTMPGHSWKFFLPAVCPVVLSYGDVHLHLDTDAPWWGVWLNEGRLNGLECVGIEPTTTASDALADSHTLVEPGATITVSWNLNITHR